MNFRNRFVYTLVFFLLCFSFQSFEYRHPFPVHSPASSFCRELLEKTFVSIDKIQGLKFHLKVSERFKGKLIMAESQVKLNRSPRKIYIYLKGPELLWLEGKNDGKVLINPDGFPFMNISLDPLGSIMRENQHHTIHEMGFEYLTTIIKNSNAFSEEKFDSYFKCTGTLQWESRECYLVTAEYPEFKYVDYVMKKGETLYSIARKLQVSDYMVMELNSSVVNGYYHGKPGQLIKVPNVYGKKLILYIDKELLVPRVIKVYDDKGLFESYEYHDLQVNPKFTDDEFSKENKAYGF